MKILHLTLKKQWFDMIASGEKKEEYREINDYWCRRFCNREWYKYEIDVLHNAIDRFPDIVSANNGYSNNCPNIKWQHKGIRIGEGKPEWGAELGKKYFILEIGELLTSK